MTEAQRVGQLFLVGIAGDPVSDVAQAVAAYHFGSLLSAGNLAAGVAGLQQLTSAYQSLATGGVRFFIAANQEGGEVQSLQGPGFPAIPSALAQGSLSPSVLQQQAAVWGRELRSAGFNLNLAPVMDVVPAGTADENQPIGMLEREFGYSPATVAAHGVAFIRGMQQAAVWGRELRSAGFNLNLAPVMDVVPAGTADQNQPIGMLEREFGYTPATVAAHGVAFIRGMQQAGVATTAKHFPGLGRVQGNTDFTAGVVDTSTTPHDSYLQSFQAAIDAGVPFVMIALATYTRIDPRHLAVFSPEVMGVILRQQMHFKGVIVSDDLGAATAVASISPAVRGIEFLTAGGDLITSQSLAAAATMDSVILKLTAADTAFRAVVNSAVMHVLSAKQAYHLLPCS